jgi:hypothetical protein
MLNPSIAGSATPSPPEAMGALLTFVWAAGGSLSLEIISLHNAIRAEKATGLPAYYRDPLFWIVRGLVAVIAGMLVIAEKAGNPLLAINIGAAAPAILDSLTYPSRGWRHNRKA